MPIPLIGQAVGIVVPNFTNLRSRYSTAEDEKKATVLAQGMVRLQLASLRHWNGSAVEFVENALLRFCEQNGLSPYSTFFPGEIRLTDGLSPDLVLYSNGRKLAAENQFFLGVMYELTELVPIGRMLSHLSEVNDSLPAAFFTAFYSNLRRWMYVYDYRRARAYAREQMEFLEEDEIRESIFPEVLKIAHPLLKQRLKYTDAISFLRSGFQSKKNSALAERIVNLCLELHSHSRGFRVQSPYRLDAVLPEIISEYLRDTDPSRPGCALVFEENDLVHTCCDEEIQHLGQESRIRDTTLLRIDASSIDGLDKSLKRAFRYVGALSRSLKIAAEIGEACYDIYETVS